MSDIEAHPLADQFDCPSWTTPGSCICGTELPPRNRWTNAGMDWSNVECSKCGRGYVDEEDFIAIYDDGLDPDRAGMMDRQKLTVGEAGLGDDR